MAFAGRIPLPPALHASPIGLVLLRQPEIAIGVCLGPRVVQLLLRPGLADDLAAYGFHLPEDEREMLQVAQNVISALNLRAGEGVMFIGMAHHGDALMACRGGRPYRELLVEQGMDSNKLSQVATLIATASQTAREVPLEQAIQEVRDAISFIESGASFGAMGDLRSVGLIPLILMSRMAAQRQH